MSFDNNVILMIDRCAAVFEEIITENFNVTDKDSFTVKKQSLLDMKYRMEAGCCRILVTGDVNCGKSSLINYLIRKENYLFVDEFPSTVEFKHVSMKDLVEVVPQSPFCGSNCTLIDSPGLNCDIKKTIAITEEQGKIDIVLFVITALNLLTLSSKEFIEGLGGGKRIFYIITKIDLVKNLERCIQILKKDLHKEEIFFISLTSGSGLKEMEEVIFSFINESFSKTESISQLLRDMVEDAFHCITKIECGTFALIEKLNTDLVAIERDIMLISEEMSSFTYDLEPLNIIFDFLTCPSFEYCTSLWDYDILLVDIINYYLIYSKVEDVVRKTSMSFYDSTIRKKCIQLFPSDDISLMSSEELAGFIDFKPELPPLRLSFSLKTISVLGFGIVLLGTKCTVVMRKFIPNKYKGIFTSVTIVSALGGLLMGQYNILDKELYKSAIDGHFSTGSPFLRRVRSYVEGHFKKVSKIKVKERKDGCTEKIDIKKNEIVEKKEGMEQLSKVLDRNKARKEILANVKKSLDNFCTKSKR